METPRASSQLAADRPSLSNRLVARHLFVLAAAMAIIGVALALDDPLLGFTLLFLPAASIAVSRVVIAPLATPDQVRWYHWATFVLVILAFASRSLPVPGLAALVALGFLWAGRSRRSPVLSGVAYGALLAVVSIDLTGPFQVSPEVWGSAPHVAGFGIVALVVLLIAMWQLRQSEKGDSAREVLPVNSEE